MKIIHTADWHIGKNLHKVPLQDQLSLFFDWLIATISTHQVDVLLVSGDVFDYANPSAEDRRMYFHFLKELVDSKTKIIITGGNHDSAGFLNAPREILDALDISIVGEATTDIHDELVEVRDSEGGLQLVVAAVPFLKDKDLRHRDSKNKYANRTEEIRAGIARHYEKLAAICREKYKEVPVIAMGHLYAVGADPSESERDIHMGNEAAVDSSVFLDVFDYVALGHIHRPQVIGKNPFIRYSGSPVALSFSEKQDIKSIVLLELQDGHFQPPTVIEVPKSRSLTRIKGSLSDIRLQLADFQVDNILPSFLEVIVEEKIYNSSIIAEFEETKLEYQDNEEFRIVKSKVIFEQGAKDIDELFEHSTSIDELKPLEVFNKKLEIEEFEDETASELREAFLELLEGIENED